MNRVLKLQSLVLKRISEFENSVVRRDYPLDWERIHMVSSAKIAQVLALKRGADPELAALACTVHDYGRVVTGKQKNHAEAGFLPVKALLSEAGFFTADEIDLISLAAKNHSSKKEIGSPVEEIVKDADVLDCHQYDIPLPREEQLQRLEKVLKELSCR